MLPALECGASIDSTKRMHPQSQNVYSCVLIPSIESPQQGQLWTLSDSDFSTRLPQREHILDVFLGSTSITIEPALAALYDVINSKT